MSFICSFSYINKSYTFPAQHDTRTRSAGIYKYRDIISIHYRLPTPFFAALNPFLFRPLARAVDS